MSLLHWPGRWAPLVLWLCWALRCPRVALVLSICAGRLVLVLSTCAARLVLVLSTCAARLVLVLSTCAARLVLVLSTCAARLVLVLSTCAARLVPVAAPILDRSSSRLHLQRKELIYFTVTAKEMVGKPISSLLHADGVVVVASPEVSKRRFPKTLQLKKCDIRFFGKFMKFTQK